MGLLIMFIVTFKGLLVSMKVKILTVSKCFRLQRSVTKQCIVYAFFAAVEASFLD